MKSSAPAWSMKVAVEDVPEAGQHFDLVADATVRSGLMKEISVRDLPRAAASFDVSRHGLGGLRVRGRVSATVGQNCVVSLDPLEAEILEEIDLVFVPELSAEASQDDETIPVSGGELPELLQNGTVDLGAIATEFLMLGIDPYPRKPDVVFESPAMGDDPASHPFAALASLKEGGSGDKKR